MTFSSKLIPPTAAPCSSERVLTEGQIQTLLQYLYSERAETRCEAIQHIITNQWHHAQLTQALTELAALDKAESVREAARRALQDS